MRDKIKIKLLQNMLEEVTRKYDYFIVKQEQLLQHTYDLAVKDKLTGLYNRQYLDDYAQKAFDRMHRQKSFIILIFIDIDNFKYVNDTFGHEEGDAVLKEVSEVFRQSFREYDLIVRYGGDEFVVLLEEMNYKHERIDFILKNIVRRVEKQLLRFKISASYGCAVAPEEAEDLETLIMLADERMYEQKREKKAAR